MEIQDEKFEQLLVNALNVFMKYGIKSVTMDDMSRHLGISKKTLYKYVKDKNDLVLQGMKYHQEQEHCVMEHLVKRDLNSIDEIFEMTKVILSQLRNVHPSVMYDLEKYYPEAKCEFESYKKTVIRQWVIDNLEKGMREGYYRKDLKVNIITNMYLARMNDFFNTDIFPPSEFTFEEVYLEIFRYHIRGLASEEGIEYLKEKIKELNK